MNYFFLFKCLMLFIIGLELPMNFIYLSVYALFLLKSKILFSKVNFKDYEYVKVSKLMSSIKFLT